MKKILLVLPNDTLGGAEQILKMIAQHYSDALVEVQFLKHKTNEEWITNNKFIRIKYQNTGSEYFGTLLYALNLLVKKKKYDYIFSSHVFTTGALGIFIRLGLLQKKYFIGRESTRIFERFKGFKLFLYRKMYRWGYPSLDLLICQTQQMRQDLVSHLPWIDQNLNIKIIANPIDLAPLKTVEILKTNFPFIISAGRLIYEKGFDILINAFKEILLTHPTHQLIILGEGYERKKLEFQIKKLHLEGKVILKGRVQNVYPYFKTAKVCVVSSRIEGFPNVLLQMMSQNNHVVSTKCAAEIEQIPGVLLVKTTNSKNLSNAILKSLNDNFSKNQILFQSFLQERSIENFIETIEAELQQ
ncbi:glycosyltransferase [Flavobacterium granuli]|uniref:Glycosyltransferase involved in cell wall biosynthesis n=1 Tax=Flavobacterium granuli TaxID=280093 RepID=A0ABU1S526_9FLAO|nr:glycosyltransferase [Flavobacterium granuli]MDR6846144.1 glycosyltransferase involved in cell wall biosynthesis [Flavobacterium granuli]